jgi:hypothetical protein
MPRQDLDLIATVLGDAVESSRTSVRLQHGLKLRAAMYEALSKNEPFPHYRLKWMSACIEEMVNVAKLMCRDFDKRHPDDMASALDLADICRGAANMVEASLQPSTPKDENTPT